MSPPRPCQHPYTDDFYDRQDNIRRSAEVVVPIVCDVVQPRAVVDVGCGVGTWLSVFQQHGVRTILGLDGDWVPRRKLRIPVEAFAAIDLTRPLAIPRRFDLVVSLEVGEHLPPEAARTFVTSLTRLGPVVLFSAAIPFQGGDGHVNEQWPEYWAAQFAAEGYRVVDCIRRRIWGNPDVEAHYAQNTLLFVERERLDRDDRLRREAETAADARLSLVHPDVYLRYADPRHVTIDATRIAEYRALSLMMVAGILPSLAKRAAVRRVRRLIARLTQRAAR